ncbi:TetR family transcriptional regulator [Actinoplanes sp. NEAU-A12]|uniref:TetR family transcriptional regulator n=1 Tax=Actinoplanes sandaracinus TaxID=3045177 RepID=A0ABT6X1R1_9ACTN|nr:TetR family transcriptional regulator [Actinoplanes sandaracinus]MDI6105962.1 TetR family transcriptional regulator [Actinoplanes sandaracinus]
MVSTTFIELVNHDLLTGVARYRAAMARPRTVSDAAILTAAAHAVAQVGPANVTLAQIGDRAGLTAAALVRRFGSKERLLLALAREAAEAVPARLAAARAAEYPLAALIDALVAMAAGVRSATAFTHHLAFLLMDLSVPEFQQVTRKYAAGVEAAIDEVLQAATAAGELEPERVDHETAEAIHAAYNGALITWGMAGHDGSPAEHVRRHLLRATRPYSTRRSKGGESPERHPRSDCGRS